MKNLGYIPLAITFLTIVASCSKFEEFNTDPDKTANANSQLLATHLILQTASYPRIGKDFLYKDMLSKYISYMEGATSYQYNKIERTDFSSLIRLTNVDKMVSASEGSVYEDSYRALGLFIRAYTFFSLTLSVGDIPYSQAIKAEDGVYNPLYDTQKEVFIGILNELDEANRLFALGRDFPGDPVFGGSTLKWQRSVNNLSLKVLTHLWKKTSDMDMNVVSRLNDIVTRNLLMESNGDNFQLSYSSLENEHYPFFNSSFRKYPIMSTTIVDRMKEFKDYRLFYFAEPSEARMAEGALPTEWGAYTGVDPSDDFSLISAKYSGKEISGINKRYYELEEGEPTFLLSYAEQCFIIAEGIVRGWTDGDAKFFYEEGIRSAMLFTAENTPDEPQFSHGIKITPEIIENYLEGSIVAFEGTLEEQLNKIFQQRYFMGFMQDGWNSFYECRRTGYPELPVNELTNLNPIRSQMPRRWMYPAKELSFNRNRVEEAINRQFSGNDDVNELMWILK